MRPVLRGSEKERGMKVFTGIIGAVLIAAGLFVGLSMGLEDEPFLAGYLGGIFPVLAGAMGAITISWAGRE